MLQLQPILILDESSAVEQLSCPVLIIIQFLYGLTIIDVVFSFGRVAFVEV